MVRCKPSPAKNTTKKGRAEKTVEQAPRQTSWAVALSIPLIGAILYCCLSPRAAADQSQASNSSEGGDRKLQLLHVNMVHAEKEATGANRSYQKSKLWLDAVMAMDGHLVATGAPDEFRGYILSEIQRIMLRHFQWNILLSSEDILQKAAPRLAARMLMHANMKTCCSDDSCLYNQVTMAMIFKELQMTAKAFAHLDAAKAAVMANGANPWCRGMMWQLNRLVAPLDNHFPIGYEHLVDVASAPVFWSPMELELAHYLEQHSTEIVAELAHLCPSEESGVPKPSGHFGAERVADDLAQGSWTSLPLLDRGSWNDSACQEVAPRTCAILKKRPELQGALRSASMPDTIIQFTFASIYRLRPQSRIHRHVGTHWRLNTHLGIVTPPGAELRVWNETRRWEAGKAFAFLDAAEHDVVHNGEADRCVLNVVSWHPSVMQQRASDSAFADHFVFSEAWASMPGMRFGDN